MMIMIEDRGGYMKIGDVISPSNKNDLDLGGTSTIKQEGIGPRGSILPSNNMRFGPRESFCHQTRRI